VTRPSFASTVEALRTRDNRFPWVGPTDEEDDIAAVLEAIEETHQATADDPDLRGRYGRCRDCRTPWPCPEWARGEQIAVLWLGRASDRVIAHARQAFDRRAAA
jgi:hypothetical protein